MNGPAQNGAPLNGVPLGGNGINGSAVNGSAPNGAGSSGYRTPDQRGNVFTGGSPAGYDAGSAGGQAQQLYGSPEQAFFQGQPGPAHQDQRAREPYAQQAYGNAPPFQQYPAQPQPSALPLAQAAQPISALPAVRAPQPVAISLSEAVKAAHGEGYSFGESVGRDAPGLWLEAVLARKPRMPSDLEARLLQGSVLPIDSLLHDEVRHSLRRGFWDALESARR